jgi:hypothetical protein
MKVERTLLAGSSVVLAAAVQVVVNFVFGFHLFGIVAHIGAFLVKLVERDNFGIKFHGKHFRFLIPDGVADAFDLEGFLDALFAHAAVAENFEFFGNEACFSGGFEGKRNGCDSDQCKKERFHGR